MRDPRERLAAGEILVGDGAMGTQLMARGMKPGDCPEAINLSHPEWLEEIGRGYAEAGADIVVSNTFGASPLKLALYELEDRLEEIVTAAIGALIRGADGAAVVSGCIGPCGELLKPYGSVDPAVMEAGFTRQARALAEAGVQAFSVETMSCLDEASYAVRAAKSVAPEVPVFATMTFNKTPRGYFTVMGIDIPGAATGLRAAGADIIGSNCGNGCEEFVGIARDFRKQDDGPLIIQPNAGLPEFEGGETVYRETPEFMAARAEQMMDLGVNVIGGCCGTTPAHIRAIRGAVDRFRKPRTPRCWRRRS
jgi:5-methyltetrahydrofolate--homocysteine methyltransferase